MGLSHFLQTTTSILRTFMVELNITIVLVSILLRAHAIINVQP